MTLIVPETVLFRELAHSVRYKSVYDRNRKFVRRTSESKVQNESVAEGPLALAVAHPREEHACCRKA